MESLSTIMTMRSRATETSQASSSQLLLICIRRRCKYLSESRGKKHGAIKSIDHLNNKSNSVVPKSLEIRAQRRSRAKGLSNLEIDMEGKDRKHGQQ